MCVIDKSIKGHFPNCNDVWFTVLNPMSSSKASTKNIYKRFFKFSTSCPGSEFKYIFINEKTFILNHNIFVNAQ